MTDNSTYRAHKNVSIFLEIENVLGDFEGQVCPENSSCEKFNPNTMSKEFWAQTQPFTEATHFYHGLKKYGNVSLLAESAVSPESYGGKAEWVVSFDEAWALTDLIICPQEKRCFLATAGNVLISSDKNKIEKWEDAGGVGILHEGDFQKTMDKVHEVVHPPAKSFTPQDFVP